MPSIANMISDLAASGQMRRAEEQGISVDELREREAAEAERQAPVEAERSERALQAREEGLRQEQDRRQRYGQHIGVGVPAYKGHLVRIGGLSNRSDGSGLAKGTVWHVILAGEFQRGRLKRASGDLLCRPASSFGERSMNLTGTNYWNDAELLRWEDREVTCAQCLAVLQRLSRG